MTGLNIPYEVADGITLAVLQDQLKYLKEELREYKEDEKYMHPEDVANSVKLIPALELIIHHFGGTV
jgi:hypothetical protein